MKKHISWLTISFLGMLGIVIACAPTQISEPPNKTSIPSCPPEPADAVIASNDPQVYVGRLYSGRDFLSPDHENLSPGEIAEIGGALLETPVEHVLSVMVTEFGPMLWVKTLICADADGNPYFRVEDAIFLPELEGQRHIFIYPGAMCVRPEGGEIIAVGDPTRLEGELVTGLEHAWEVTWPGGRLIQISTREVRCYSGAGLEY